MINKIVNYSACLIGLFPAVLTAQIKPVVTGRECPNVILVLTDDQGIGGLSCHGNPYLKTPCLDRFYEESIRMTDFHVSPMSTPTRSAIITGRYPIRNGAWATFKGRDIISRNSRTIAEVFRDNGYSTALFGKWHLGDNYPSRPTDCGFEYAVQHRSGGVGELSDYWGNNYFDDTYWVNNEPHSFKGYCTDVWFQEAEKFITRQKESEKPFFIYLSTNAPHGPHYVAEQYSAPYKLLQDKGILKDAGFYGQIANLDKNFGKLDNFLKKNGLDENTIVIFMTDNGAAMADNTWVYGYRGAKGSRLEGGHRVPFFIRSPKGGLEGGKDISAMVAHVDLLPTLSALCGIGISDEDKLDGIDFSPVLQHKGKLPQGRTVFIHHRQDSKPPYDVKESCILKDNWRLLDGDKLYNLSNDKLQQKNIAASNPQLVKELLEENKEFVKQTKQLAEYRNFIPVVAGSPEQKVVVLTIQHAIGEDGGLWKAEQVAEGIKNRNNGYAIEFATTGTYHISLARWPRECQGEIHGVPERNPKSWYSYKEIKPEKAVIELDGRKYSREINANMKEVCFEVKMKQGTSFLKADFVENGQPFGAYYIYIEGV